MSETTGCSQGMEVVLILRVPVSDNTISYLMRLAPLKFIPLFSFPPSAALIRWTMHHPGNSGLVPAYPNVPA